MLINIIMGRATVLLAPPFATLACTFGVVRIIGATLPLGFSHPEERGVYTPGECKKVSQCGWRTDSSPKESFGRCARNDTTRVGAITRRLEWRTRSGVAATLA
jgi:hypothetical protein